MDEPIFIEPIFQKDSGDCAVCCLVMLLGKPYPDVVAACPAEYLGKPYNAVKSGMTSKMMIEAANKLGATLKLHHTVDLQEDTGILTVLKGKKRTPQNKDKDTHAVMLINGSIIDPMDARFWPSVETFLQVEDYRTGTILKLCEDVT